MQRGGFDRIGIDWRPREQPRVPAATWVQVCRFQAANQYQTLDMVIAAVERAMDRYKHRGSDTSIERPVVVFDLDDTVFKSNQVRTMRILREWLDDRPSLHWEIRRSLETVRAEELAYTNKDTFSKVAGLDLGAPRVKKALADFDKYWNERFFSNEYCQDDPLQYGALEYVKKLHDLGASIAYLTGRDEARMGKGTRAAINKSGLPRLSSRVKVFLKPHKDDDDAAFKKSVRSTLLAWGPVVATFDNAPANCVVLKDSFPKAINVFVDTVYPAEPVEIRHGLFKIFDFSRRRGST
ncbi:MAG TPA: HAD family hydrolase [Myxococcota bacterium]|nr:HAD family hydrolase [Myxococcota bacterium]